jgi:hypothetical protein
MAQFDENRVFWQHWKKLKEGFFLLKNRRIHDFSWKRKILNKIGHDYRT